MKGETETAETIRRIALEDDTDQVYRGPQRNPMIANKAMIERVKSVKSIGVDVATLEFC